MNDLWWCETCNTLYPSEMQDRAVTVDCRMVRLTAHHQDCPDCDGGRMDYCPICGPFDGMTECTDINHMDYYTKCPRCDGRGKLFVGLLAWDRCENCDGIDPSSCPACHDGWVPRAAVQWSTTKGERAWVALPLEGKE